MEALAFIILTFFSMICILDYRVDELKKVIEEDRKQIDELKEEINLLKCR